MYAPEKKSLHILTSEWQNTFNEAQGLFYMAATWSQAVACFMYALFPFIGHTMFELQFASL